MVWVCSCCYECTAFTRILCTLKLYGENINAIQSTCTQGFLMYILILFWDVLLFFLVMPYVNNVTLGKPERHLVSQSLMCTSAVDLLYINFICINV